MNTTPRTNTADRFDVRPFARRTATTRPNRRRPRPAPFNLTRAELVAALLALVFAAAPAIAAVIYYVANLGNR